MNFIEIPLSKGLRAKISPQDYDRVICWKWHANQACKPGLFYARGRITDSQGKRRHILLHVFIMGKTGYDHIDRDPLNCTRENLRLPPTKGHNLANTAARSSTGFKGVYLRNGKYDVYISAGTNKSPHRLGRFDDAIEAAKAYDKAAFDKWGEFAKLNFPIP